MADGIIKVKTVAAADGTTVSAEIGNPINKTYTGIVTEGVAILVMPVSDLVSAANINWLITLGSGSKTDTKSGNDLQIEADPTSIPVNSGLVSLSSSNGVVSISVQLQQNAPIKIYWRIVGAAAWSSHSQTSNDNSTGASSPFVQTINGAGGLNIEAYAEDHVNNTYTTPVESILVPNISSDVFQIGAPYTGTHLANLEVGRLRGTSPRRVAFAFLAQKNDAVTSIRNQLIRKAGNPGYSLGTGGTIMARIVGDDSGVPGVNVMGSAQLEMNLTSSSPTPISEPFVFIGSSALTQGSVYWVTFENIDPDPAANYCSMNNMSGYDLFSNRWFDDINQVPSHYSDDGATWNSTEHTPILEVGYADGTFYGTTLFEGYSWNSQPSVGGDDLVRQNIYLPVDVEVHDLAVYIARDYGPGALKADFKNAAGVVVGTGQLASSQIPLEDPPVTIPSPHRDSEWRVMTMDSPFTISQGVAYTAEFYADAGTKYFITPAKMGVNYGFQSHGFFGHRAQTSEDGGANWVNWYYNYAYKNDAQLSLLINPGSPLIPS